MIVPPGGVPLEDGASLGVNNSPCPTNSGAGFCPLRGDNLYWYAPFGACSVPASVCVGGSWLIVPPGGVPVEGGASSALNNSPWPLS